MNKKCVVEECSRTAICKQYCDMHYRRFKKYGKPTNIRRNKGEGCLDKRGYIRVPNPRGGQIHQHRLIMESYLGRPLSNQETVHHKNGNRSDNRIENLELWSSRHPSGQRVEDKIEWCISFLKDYNYLITKDTLNATH
jgi:hypothetical protein